MGSSEFPSDLLIFRPCSSMMSGVTKTSPNGSGPRKCRPIITILATQRNRISRAVTSTCVGYHAFSSGVSSGHPKMENGHSALENHVSSVSSSCRRFALPQTAQWSGADFATVG